jgi:hypothetical protein
VRLTLKDPLRPVVQLLHAASGDVVDPALGTCVRGLPCGTDEALSLEPPEGPVEPAGVRAVEPESANPFEQVVPVGRLLAEKEQQAGTQKVPGKRRAEVVWRPQGRSADVAGTLLETSRGLFRGGMAPAVVVALAVGRPREIGELVGE